MAVKVSTFCPITRRRRRSLAFIRILRGAHVSELHAVNAHASAHAHGRKRRPYTEEPAVRRSSCHHHNFCALKAGLSRAAVATRAVWESREDCRVGCLCVFGHWLVCISRAPCGGELLLGSRVRCSAGAWQGMAAGQPMPMPTTGMGGAALSQPMPAMTGATCMPAGGPSKAEILGALEAGDAHRVSSTDWDLSGALRVARSAASTPQMMALRCRLPCCAARRLGLAGAAAGPCGGGADEAQPKRSAPNACLRTEWLGCTTQTSQGSDLASTSGEGVGGGARGLCEWV